MRLPRPTKVTRKQAGQWESFHLSVPTHMARQIPDGVVFVPEFTDEGILYRVLVPSPPPEPEPVPAWLQQPTD